MKNIERKDGRVMVSLEKRHLIEARFKLQATGVPRLFHFVADMYPGCEISESIGNTGEGEWPHISIRGPWGEWNRLHNKSLEEVKDASEVTVGIIYDGEKHVPSVVVTGMHQNRPCAEASEKEVKEFSFSKQVHMSDKRISEIPLIILVAQEMEKARLLSPSRFREETDMTPVWEMVAHLGPF